MTFIADETASGDEAIEMVRQAAQLGEPYEIALLAMARAKPPPIPQAPLNLLPGSKSYWKPTTAKRLTSSSMPNSTCRGC
jgi:hypothetical protein